MKTFLTIVLAVLMSVFLAGVAIAGDNSLVAGGQVITGHSLFPFYDPSEPIVTPGSASTMASTGQAEYPYLAGGEVITGHSLFPFNDPSEPIVTAESAMSHMASTSGSEPAKFFVAGGQVINEHSLFPFSDPSEIRLCLLNGMTQRC